MNEHSQVERTLTVQECKAEHASRITQISATLHQSSGWMKLIAVTGIIGVAFSLINGLWTMGVVGGSGLIWVLLSLVLSIIPVWTAVLLFRAATHVSRAASAGDDMELDHSLDQLRLYFKITGVLVLISLILTVAGVVFGIPIALEILSI